MTDLVASVGRDGKNNPDDVRTVQELLNRYPCCRPDPPLEEDGLIGPDTIAAIEEVQRHIDMSNPDGRVDPGGRTFTAIAEEPDAGEDEEPPAGEENAPAAGNALTVAQLRAIMPNLKADKAADYFPHLTAAMEEFEISANVLREAAFLAQVAHESGEFRYMREIWGPTPTRAQKGYEGRADLGNTQPGDGKRFKGRGPIQITGRANYKKYGALLGLPLTDQPEMAETPAVAFRVAGAFWKTHGLNELADQQAFKRITKIINGGYNGLEDRTKYYNRAKQVLAA
jgi:putative chitinase